MGYDEELSRVVNYTTMIKSVLPKSLVAAPSTNSWWFCEYSLSLTGSALDSYDEHIDWTSDVGRNDTAAHGNIDFIPWFLMQMKNQEKTAGKRLLDFLDIHYYFQANPQGTDDASRALRLRLTRSWWDPTYVDESWVGTSTPQNSQPNPTAVMFIPRMQALIAKYYPGTKLSVGEWASTLDSDITGGLVAADSLGIFGKYKLDSANYWVSADRTGPVGLAYWLYRG